VCTQSEPAAEIPQHMFVQILPERGHAAKQKVSNIRP